MNRPRVTSQPRTAMELAFNKAVQEFAAKKKAPPAQTPTLNNSPRSIHEPQRRA